MNLQHIIMENIRRIQLADCSVDKNGVIQVTGLNETGKSTFLNAIKWPLAGKANVPDNVITEGERKGKIELTIGEADTPIYKVRLNFRKGGPVCKVWRVDGSPLPKSQQALLDTFFNDISIEPLKFARMKPKERRETLLKAVNLAVDKNDFVALAGRMPQDDEDPLQVLDAAYKQTYEERRDVNRDLNSRKSQLKQYQDVPDDAPEISAGELLAERREIEQLKSKRERLGSRYAELSSKLTDLEQQLRKIEEARDDVRDELDELPVPSDERLSEIDNQLEHAEEFEHAKQKRRLIKEADDLQKQSDQLSNKLEDVVEYKDQLVEESMMPMEGLSFDDEDVVFEGQSLEARGISQRIKIGIAIGAALNPQLKLVLIDEGSELDDKSVLELSEWARENGYQIVMAREQYNSPDGIAFTIENGETVRYE